MAFYDLVCTLAAFVAAPQRVEQFAPGTFPKNLAVAFPSLRVGDFGRESGAFAPPMRAIPAIE